MTGWIDVTRPLDENTPAYADDERFRAETTASVERDGYRLTFFHMGAHCGTHMDAPAHYLSDGATIDRAPPDLLIGEAAVATGFEQNARGVARLLCKMEKGLSREQALFIARSGVRLFGCNALSVAPPDDEAEIHRILLKNGVWIVENLDLSGVPDGSYDLCCLPLCLKNREGAPVRAFLRRRDG